MSKSYWAGGLSHCQWSKQSKIKEFVRSRQSRTRQELDQAITDYGNG